MQMLLRAGAICLAMGLLALVGWSTPAEACSCQSDQVTFPADGATQVPLNVQPTYVSRSAQFSGELLLRENVSGQAIESASEVFERGRSNSYLQRLGPATSLLPDTRYEFVRRGSDSEIILATFTTGSVEDLEAPLTPQLTSFVPEVMIDLPATNSCVGGYLRRSSRFRSDIANLSDDTVYALLLVESSDSEFWQSDTIPLFAGEDFGVLGVSDTWYCGATPPILDLGSRVCARIVAYDVAGNSSSSEEICEDTVQCAGLVDDVSQAPIPECLPPDTGSRGGCGIAPSSETSLFALVLLVFCLRRQFGCAATGSSTNHRY